TEIGDSADVQHDASDARMAIDEVIEEGNQRRTFASCGHVRRAEVGHRRCSSARRYDRALARLPGDRQFAAEERLALATVIERLTVAADQLDAQPRPASGFGDRF